MPRILDLADGYQSATNPSALPVNTNKLQEFISDGAYETAYGPLTGIGYIYFNTTLDKTRVYTSTGWVTVGDNATIVQETPPETPNGVITQFTVVASPLTSQSIIVYKDGMVVKKDDWTYTSGLITFDTAPSGTEEIYFSILTNGVPASPPVLLDTQDIDRHVLTGGEISAKQFTLNFTPVEPTKVLAFWYAGGGLQKYGVDFTISSNVFNFNGLGLDGELVAGDEIHVWALS